MPLPATSHRQTLATLVVILFFLVVVALSLNVVLLNQSASRNGHCIARSPADNNNNNSTIGHDDPDADMTDDDLYFSDTLYDTTHHAVLKEPTTPPKSLPSDPYAHYIYRKELPLPKSMESLKGPGGKGPKRSRTRTIVIGDVHGHLEGLNSFLKEISYDKKTDALILAGDMVTKGDKSLEVIDRARELGAYCVRGNHDDKVVRWRGFLDSLSLVDLQSLDEMDLEDNQRNEDDDVQLDLEDPSSQVKLSPLQKKDPSWRPKIPSDLNRKSAHYRLARSMNKAQYQYLRNCPLILSLPRELSLHDIPVHVVHAGIDPSQDILKQRPWVLVNVRNLLKDGTPSSQRDQGLGWARTFNELHCEKPSSKDNMLRPATDLDFMVIYGHDASRSLNVMPWSVGLDTGCVYGRTLTGYVVETGKSYSVPCSKLREACRMD